MELMPTTPSLIVPSHSCLHTFTYAISSSGTILPHPITFLFILQYPALIPSPPGSLSGLSNLFSWPLYVPMIALTILYCDHLFSYVCIIYWCIKANSKLSGLTQCIISRGFFFQLTGPFLIYAAHSAGGLTRLESLTFWETRMPWLSSMWPLILQ